MPRRTPQEARTLGLWTASWLGLLLVAGLLWVGDLSVQWPVLLVPALWALIALRPRHGGRGSPGRERRSPGRERGTRWRERDLPPPVRTDTVERPFPNDRTERRRGPR